MRTPSGSCSSSPRSPEKRTCRAPSASASGSMPSACAAPIAASALVMLWAWEKLSSSVRGRPARRSRPAHARRASSTLSARTSAAAPATARHALRLRRHGANVITRTSLRRCGRSASSAAGTTQAARLAPQLGDQLRLRLGHPLDRPDQLEVHRADVRDHADVRVRDPRQLADLSHAAHRHLEHQHPHPRRWPRAPSAAARSPVLKFSRLACTRPP